jgi:Na+/H+-dicarboxylate symporter
MIIILGALNLPTNDISLIYTIDWFLDRLRTTINVWGDAIGNYNIQIILILKSQIYYFY